MAISELLASGLELMLLGMGIVFVFLTILVITLRGMCALAARFDDGEPEVAAPAAVNVTDGGAADSTVVAVISAAIARYRSAQRA